jgi:hypothetical protein
MNELIIKSICASLILSTIIMGILIGRGKTTEEIKPLNDYGTTILTILATYLIKEAKQEDNNDKLG